MCPNPFYVQVWHQLCVTVDLSSSLMCVYSDLQQCEQIIDGCKIMLSFILFISSILHMGVTKTTASITKKI